MSTAERAAPPTSRIEDEELGVALVGDLLRRAREGRFEVARLTDEELTVLDGADSKQVVPRPWWSGLDESGHEMALAVALRSLAARGIVVPSLLEESTGRMAVAVDDDVHAVLVARRAASLLVLAERRTLHASWFKACYLQGEAGVIEEDVSPGGLHTLIAAPVEDIVGSLAAFADPEGAAEEDPRGEAREVALSDVASGTAKIGPLGDSRYVSVITVVGLDGDGASSTRRLSVYVNENGVETARRVEDDRKVLNVEPVSPSGLRAGISDVVGVGAQP